MKRRWYILVVAALMLMVACSPVIRRDLMSSGSRDVPMAKMQETPSAFENKLFILGGMVVKTRNTNDGSLIEAIYLPVNSYGYVKDYNQPDGRYLALLPKAGGFLDPEIYSKGRYVTIAGAFTGVRKGKIDEVEYRYPTFEIKDIYLWEKPEVSRYLPFYYPYYAPYPYGPYSYWGWSGPSYYPYGPYWW